MTRVQHKGECLPARYRHFEKSSVWIKWIGTHQNYDKVDKADPDQRDYEAALKETERLWGAKGGPPEGDRLDVLATFIGAYEAEH